MGGAQYSCFCDLWGASHDFHYSHSWESAKFIALAFCKFACLQVTFQLHLQYTKTPCGCSNEPMKLLCWLSEFVDDSLQSPLWILRVHCNFILQFMEFIVTTFHEFGEHIAVTVAGMWHHGECFYNSWGSMCLLLKAHSIIMIAVVSLWNQHNCSWQIVESFLAIAFASHRKWCMATLLSRAHQGGGAASWESFKIFLRHKPWETLDLQFVRLRWSHAILIEVFRSADEECQVQYCLWTLVKNNLEAMDELFYI